MMAQEVMTNELALASKMSHSQPIESLQCLCGNDYDWYTGPHGKGAYKEWIFACDSSMNNM